jgi:2-polyprenyl-3-methyl-5-hydroxy-6-metoxy-1,4-benzoquinol methylase
MSRPDHTYHDYSQPDPPHQPLCLASVLRHLRSDPGIKTVLDAGCGDGNFTASLSEEGGYDMYGIDLSQGGIQRARERWPGILFAEWSLNDDLRGAFPGIVAFDAIVSVEVIEHLYSPRTFMQRALETLRPGGLLILTTPYWGYLKNIVLAVTDRTDRALTALWEGGHIKHWSYRTLRTLGEQQGFEFVAFDGVGRSVPYLWKGMVMVFRAPGPAKSI